MDILFLIGRILFGGFFIMAGLNHFAKMGMMAGYAASKGVMAPKASVLVTGLMLVFGGVGMLGGFLIPWAVLSLSLFLITAALKFHDFWNVQDPQQKMAQMLFFLRNIALTGAALMMLAIPQPWVMSL